MRTSINQNIDLQIDNPLSQPVPINTQASTRKLSPKLIVLIILITILLLLSLVSILVSPKKASQTLVNLDTQPTPTTIKPTQTNSRWFTELDNIEKQLNQSFNLDSPQVDSEITF